MAGWGWSKESPAAGTHRAGWPEKLREVGGGAEFCPLEKVPESGTSGCPSMRPLTHLSSLLSTGAGSAAELQGLGEGKLLISNGVTLGRRTTL